jgi:hypothetical protein
MIQVSRDNIAIGFMGGLIHYQRGAEEIINE